MAGGGEGSGISASGSGEALGVCVAMGTGGEAVGVSRLQARVKAASKMLNFPREKPAGGQ